jgi:hypothetical protein
MEFYMHLNRKIKQLRVKLSLHLIKHYTLKTYGVIEVQLYHPQPQHYMDTSGQLHAPAALSLGNVRLHRLN